MRGCGWAFFQLIDEVVDRIGWWLRGKPWYIRYIPLFALMALIGVAIGSRL